MKDLETEVTDVLFLLESMSFWDENNSKLKKLRRVTIQMVLGLLHQARSVPHRQANDRLDDEQVKEIHRNTRKRLEDAVMFYNLYSNCFIRCNEITLDDNTYVFGWDINNNVIIYRKPFKSPETNLVKMLHTARAGIRGWEYNDRCLFVDNDIDDNFKSTYSILTDTPVINFDFKAELLKEL